MEDIIQDAISRTEADYLEIRLEDRKTSLITYRGKDLDEISEKHSSGGFIRAKTGSGWGYASFSNKKDLLRMAKKAEQSSQLIKDDEDYLKPVEPFIDKVVPNFINNPADVDIKEKEELVKDYNDIILETPNVQSSVAVYSEEIIDKGLYTSEGTKIEEQYVDMNMIFSSIARKGDNIQTVHDMEYSSVDFDKMRNLDKMVEDAANRSVELLDAKPAEPGIFDVVIDPHLTGVFAHEAFGHLSEADFVSQNQGLIDVMQLGREFGQEFLNIIDDGSPKDLPGCHKYDDEGVMTGKTYLLKEGRLTGRLHSRETAARMGEEITGNARAVSFFYEPVVRMTCTYVDKGDWDKDEMIRGIDNGYYVKSSRGGQTNLEQFVFAGEEAYRIENGEITYRVRDINLSGNLFSTLKNIDAVGNDLKLHGGGSCGKGKHFPLPVADGGPHIRMRNIVIGGTA